MATTEISPAVEVQDDDCYVSLTEAHLHVQTIMDKVRSPQAGAIVLFAGTTRDNFAGKPVKELQYSAYNRLALRTMMDIAKSIKAKHELKGVAIIHRLGVVPIGEESILIAMSSPHRQAAWRAGEEALEEIKARVEVWKKEEFEGEEGVWRANRDGVMGVKDTANNDATPKIVWPDESGGSGNGGKQEEELGPMGPVIRPRRPGEFGHGPVVHPKPEPKQE